METGWRFFFPGDDDPWVSGLFRGTKRVWEGVPRILKYIDEVLDKTRDVPGKVPPGIAVHEGMITVEAPVELKEDLLLPKLRILVRQGALLEPGVLIKPGALIGKGAQIRQGAYLRDGVIVAEGAVVGHVTEVKNAIFFAGAEAGHFAYVGDSILGRRANLGAGTKLANLELRTPEEKLRRQSHTIVLRQGEEAIDTGLRKLGAILGDDVEVGCNAVTSPGVLVGPRSWIYSTITVRKGFYPADSIIRLQSREMDVTPRT